MNNLFFKRKVWLIMSLFFVMSISVKSQSKDFKWPETPASEVFQDFIKYYNTGNEKQIRKFVKANYRKTEASYVDGKVEDWVDFFYRYGQITPHSVSINKPYDLEVWVHGKVSKAWFAPKFVLDKKSGKIRGTGMLQGALPEGIKTGSEDEKTMLAKFESYLSENTKKGLFQGSVILQKGNELILSKGYGYKNIEEKTKNTIDTRTRISSIQKTITAIACLKLVQEGLLDLNIPVSNYLPELPEHISSKFTVADVLSHTSGYELDGIAGFREAQEKTTSMQEAYQLQLKYLPQWEHYMSFEPDHKYDYSNDSYDLAAIIIEKITGMKFENFIKKYIFDVSGMTATSFEPDNSTGFYRYDLASKGLKNYVSFYPSSIGKISGAGNLVSTSKDLQLLFNTLLKTNKLLDMAHKSMLFSPRVKQGKATNIDVNPDVLLDKKERKRYNSYALGIFVNYDSVLNLGHSGGNIGNTSEWIYFPESDYLLIVLSNNRNGAINAYNYFKTIIPR